MQRSVRQQEGGAYESERYLDPRSVALSVLTALEAGRDAELTDITVRPGG
jgi:NADP-dependent 3-hydroxy acid dehydrogenase YdfG